MSFMFEGYDEDQVAAIVDLWQLGRPIDVAKFMERADGSSEVKRRIDLAGEMFDTSPTSDAEAAQRNRLMQAQILIEVTKIHRERRPDETPFKSR